MKKRARDAYCGLLSHVCHEIGYVFLTVSAIVAILCLAPSDDPGKEIGWGVTLILLGISVLSFVVGSVVVAGREEKRFEKTFGIPYDLDSASEQSAWRHVLRLLQEKEAVVAELRTQEKTLVEQPAKLDETKKTHNALQQAEWEFDDMLALAWKRFGGKLFQ